MGPERLGGYRSSMSLVFTICLIAAALSVAVFLHAVIGAREGHQDESGFHPEPKLKVSKRPRAKPRSGHPARPRLPRAAHAR